MEAYVHIEYSTYKLSEESKGGLESTPPPPCGTEKSVVLRGLRGGRGKVRFNKEERTFYSNKKVTMAFMAWPLVERLFLRFPLMISQLLFNDL